MTRRFASDLTPVARDLRWLRHMDRHGPQSSELLFELTRDTHRCKDTAVRRLQALREAGYLRLPGQQNSIAKADFHPHVYDLTPQGIEHLGYHFASERHARPTGHWWHAFWVASVSSAVEIRLKRTGLTFIPAARILAIKGVTSAIPLAQGKVIPDQLFAIKYPDGFRAFALEVDRGTEPVRSTAARKSLAGSVAGYQEILDYRVHAQHFGLKSNLLVVYIFMSRARQRQFLDLLPEGKRRFLTRVCAPGFPTWMAVAPVAELFEF